MKLTKKQLGENKIKLSNRIKAICEMNAEQLREELPRTCGFKPGPETTDGELRWILCQWAIHDAIPGSCVE